MPTQDDSRVSNKSENGGFVKRMMARVPWFRSSWQLVEPVNGSFLKAVWCEFLCTLLFIYLATGSVVFGCSTTETSDGTTGTTGSSGGTTATPTDCLLDNSRVVAIALSFGFTIFVLVYVAAAFSGGHLNPAVSLAFLLAKKISFQRFLCYFVAQLVGAIVGSGFVKATDKAAYEAAAGGTNKLLAGLPQSAGWLIEAILTFMLVFVVFTAVDQARAQSTSHLPILAPLAIGFAVFICHLAALPIDGTSVNPARSFGPAVVYGYWADHWIFWVGPWTGAIVAFLVYEFTFRPSQEPINSVDYTYEDGKTVQSSRLPGYSGVAGLDVDQDMLKRKKEEQDGQKGDSNGNSNGGSNGLSKRNPPPKRDTANDFNQADGNTGGNNGGYAPTPVSYNPASNGYPSSGNNGYGQNPMYQSEVINSGTRFIEGSGGRSYEDPAGWAPSGLNANAHRQV